MVETGHQISCPEAASSPCSPCVFHTPSTILVHAAPTSTLTRIPFSPANLCSWPVSALTLSVSGFHFLLSSRAHHFSSTSSVPSALLWSSTFQRKVSVFVLELFMLLFRSIDYKTTRTAVNTNILINSWTPGPADWMRTWVILGLFWKNFRRIAKLIQSSHIPFTQLPLILTSVESWWNHQNSAVNVGTNVLTRLQTL